MYRSAIFERQRYLVEKFRKFIFILVTSGLVPPPPPPPELLLFFIVRLCVVFLGFFAYPYINPLHLELRHN